ncbi:MAG: metallophosphoesterase [Muribaculaceae bacterium]|nr:metallophosphoesterase [Muribaculaceae bacterium]
MRIFWLPFVAFILLGFVIDWIIGRKLKKSGLRWGHVLAGLNHTVSIAAVVMLVMALWSQPQDKAEFASHFATTAGCLLVFLIVNVPKFLWAIFYGLGSIRFLRKDFKILLKAAGAGLAVVSLVTLLVGSIVTPYKSNVTRVDLNYSNLPAQFDGYRIVHISDAHLGNFDDTVFVSQCVDSINALAPDVVCFTGDLVSMTVEEAKPFANVLKRIKARDGVYSILGNHDYAEYMRMLTPEQKAADVKELCDLQCGIGWTLLDNTSATVKRGNDSIAIVGTANYGDPPFPVYGDYAKATAGLDGVFKVHMQHNPYMWRKALVGKEDAPLTLSGHTHAMQFVINLFGNRWSPSSWRYPEWGGLYEEGDQALYVNTGLGMVGPPLRVGVPPEITLITLHHKN